MRTDWDALEFTKTRGWESRDRSDDELGDYAGLIDWCRRRALVAPATADALAREAARRPRAARAALTRAREFRDLAYGVLRTLGTGHRPGPRQLRDVAAWVERYASARRLVESDGRIAWSWAIDPEQLDRLLAPIAWSLAELLVAPEASRVHLCEGDDCGWLFVDASRAGSRRWCTMSDCGNLMKARRHRGRSRPDQ